MPGPLPTFRPEFPEDFVEQARRIGRQRVVPFQIRQRAKLVVLLYETPYMSNAAAGRQVELHPESVRQWRRRWYEGEFSLQDKSGRGRKPTFSPSGSRGRHSDCL
jgi:hypothetical protein